MGYATVADHLPEMLSLRNEHHAREPHNMNDARSAKRQALNPHYVNPGSFVNFVEDALLGLFLIAQNSWLKRHL
jgi:hypothetical protein